MRHGNVYVQLLGHIVKATDKAIYFEALKPDGSFHSPEWFPKSQCMSIKETYDEIEGTYDVLMISEWILGQKTGMLEAQREQVGVKKVRDTPVGEPSFNFLDMDDDIPY